MTVPALYVTTLSPLETNSTVIAVGVVKTADGPALASEDEAFAALAGVLVAIGATGSADELHRLPPVADGTPSIALVGLGSAVPTVAEWRYAAGTAARLLRGIDSLTLAFPAGDADSAVAILEGAAIGAYAYTRYRSDSLASAKLPAASITLCSSVSGTEAIVERATAIATAVHTVRDLVNMPPGDLYPESFAATAVALAEDSAVTVDVLAEAELEAGGFGGLLGVGKGSDRGPRLVRLSYEPGSATQHIALVGKGITFDSGGLSLKPAASMIGMKYDMTGAASALAVILAVARLGLPVRMTGWLCLAENMPSGSATRPNDVLRIRGGKTVEVLNTDAEGRLVMADGLVAASEERPDAIIDIATLTGAARVALGDRYVGAMGADALIARAVDSARSVDELMWGMPLPAELRPLLNSDVADIANIKPGNTAAGMLIAAVFLREFVGTAGEGPDARPIPWLHLDIAGPANNSAGGYGFTGKGPTGVAVRTLIALAEDFSRA